MRFGKVTLKSAVRLCLPGVMSKLLYITRWILVPPSADFGWFLAFFGSLYLLGFVYDLCPPELIVSGSCTAKWHPGAESAVIAFGAALAAVFVVLFPALLAPGHRFRVAVIAYCVGVLVAVWMSGLWRFPPLWLFWSTGRPLTAALAAGLITVFFVRRWARRRAAQLAP